MDVVMEMPLQIGNLKSPRSDESIVALGIEGSANKVKNEENIHYVRKCKDRLDTHIILETFLNFPDRVVPGTAHQSLLTQEICCCCCRRWCCVITAAAAAVVALCCMVVVGLVLVLSPTVYIIALALAARQT